MMFSLFLLSRRLLEGLSLSPSCLMVGCLKERYFTAGYCCPYICLYPFCLSSAHSVLAMKFNLPDQPGLRAILGGAVISVDLRDQINIIQCTISNVSRSIIKTLRMISAPPVRLSKPPQTRGSSRAISASLIDQPDYAPPQLPNPE